FYLIILTPPHTHTLFPYTTLFRSDDQYPTETKSPKRRRRRRFHGEIAGKEREHHEPRPKRAHAEGDLEHQRQEKRRDADRDAEQDRKSTRLNSSHVAISYAVFCLN